MAGIKELTLDNWQEPDPVMAAFGRISPAVGPVRMTAGDWARRFLAVNLTERTPDDIRTLFAVARGTLLYGWFFYPLYAIGEDQLHRVGDSAVAARYAQLDGPPGRGGRPPTSTARLKWLNQAGVVPDADTPRWSAIRELRNIGSHPEFQSLHPPGEVLSSLTIVADAIEALFDR